ncbi:MAG: hypothetical protein ABIJ56_14620 [Pseudomonadota bacterium]
MMKQAAGCSFFALLVLSAACTRCGGAGNPEKETSVQVAALPPEKAAEEKQPEAEKPPVEPPAEPPAKPAGKGIPIPPGRAGPEAGPGC